MVRGAAGQEQQQDDRDYIDKSDERFADLYMSEQQRTNLLENWQTGDIDHAVMNLFYSSPFYQKESNNEKLRQQQVTDNYQNRLLKEKGIQFVISKNFLPEINLFWIEKRLRRTDKPNDFDLISVYYALNFEIFQAPTLAQIIDSRINNSIFFQKKAFEIIQQATNEDESVAVITNEALLTGGAMANPAEESKQQNNQQQQQQQQQLDALPAEGADQNMHQPQEAAVPLLQQTPSDYEIGQTHDLDFIFEIAEHQQMQLEKVENDTQQTQMMNTGANAVADTMFDPYRNQVHQPNQQEQLLEQHLTETEVHSIWHKASKLHEQ